MLFNSFTFLAFIIIVLGLHYAPFSWKTKKINLLLASYLFYAVWNPPFILLLWISTAIDFVVGKKLYYEEHKAKRKFLLALSLIVNLGMLGFFKYGGFLLENFVVLANSLGFNYHPAPPDIILPVGISFYTFQTLSYTLDMYRKHIEPEKSLLDFSLFVTFFPQLVAGPIVRPGQLLPQFKTPHQANGSQFMHGLMLLTLGLFMKVVLADIFLSNASDLVFGSRSPLVMMDAWLGVLAFSGQIFFDFAGYSTCAIGMAACLGFTLPDNFRYPYAAIGFSDFWRRWHITLSTWLRDYLYIPLGGNRKGNAKAYMNLMITMLLGGLWHGASWTFVAWGALHGTYLCVERLFRRKLAPPDPELNAGQELIPATSVSLIAQPQQSRSLNRFMWALLTFFLVNVTWVFFRATDFTSAWMILKSMFTFQNGGAAVLPGLDIMKVSIVIPLMVAMHWLLRNSSIVHVAQKMKWWVMGIIWAGMLIMLFLSQKSGSSFIYFQF